MQPDRNRHCQQKQVEPQVFGLERKPSPPPRHCASLGPLLWHGATIVAELLCPPSQAHLQSEFPKFNGARLATASIPILLLTCGLALAKPKFGEFRVRQGI